jgi:hypothetical protein
MSLLALLAIACAGAGLVEAGLPRRAGDLALRCALAFALGLGTWSAAYAAQWLAFGARGTAAKDLLLACAGAALFLAKRSAHKSQTFSRSKSQTFSDTSQTSSGKSQTFSGESQTSPAAAPGAPRWLMGLFAAACALTALLFVEHTLRFPDGGWDAWMLWNLRARFLVRAADAGAAFSPQMLFWAHQDYPWLLPGVVAQVFLLRGESYAAPAAIAFLFGALLVALVVLFVSRLYGRRAGLLAGLALCGMPCFVTFTANQQSDVPLALYLFAAAALLQLDAPLLAGFAAGLGLWTKNEGLVYALCLAAGLLALKRSKLPPFLLGALPGLALLAAFKLLAAPPSAFVGESALARAFDVHRWGELLLLSLRRAVYFQDFALWIVAWLLALAVMGRKLVSPLGVSLALAFAACAGIYLVQPQPLDWIFRTSADRLFMQLWPLAILLTLPALLRARART